MIYGTTAVCIRPSSIFTVFGGSRRYCTGAHPGSHHGPTLYSLNIQLDWEQKSLNHLYRARVSFYGDCPDYSPNIKSVSSTSKQSYVSAVYPPGLCVRCYKGALPQPMTITGIKKKRNEEQKKGIQNISAPQLFEKLQCITVMYVTEPSERFIFLPFMVVFNSQPHSRGSREETFISRRCHSNEPRSRRLHQPSSTRGPFQSALPGTDQTDRWCLFWVIAAEWPPSLYSDDQPDRCSDTRYWYGTDVYPCSLTLCTLCWISTQFSRNYLYH